MKHLQFPIGEFQYPSEVRPELRQIWISEIEGLPKQISELLQSVTEVELETPYRPEGWTVRQVVHHLADSHINSLTRFKLALTEDSPTIRPYLEHLWAELPDGKHYPIENTLSLLHALHARWVFLLKNIPDEAFEQRRFYHPENKSYMSLSQALAMYAWHGKHHLAHIALVVK
ncbi:MAG: YfiT family bacillithiol transferase [Bacteroidia bacterium]